MSHTVFIFLKITHMYISSYDWYRLSQVQCTCTFHPMICTDLGAFHRMIGTNLGTFHPMIGTDLGTFHRMIGTDLGTFHPMIGTDLT